VAYVNQDAPVSGSAFSAAASPELKALARAAAQRVADPVRGGTVYEAWHARVVESLDAEAAAEPLPVGDLGGGSDHKGFYQHLGIPAIGFGFGGRGGVYHSMYDTPRWMQEFGDPGYLYHAATARVAAVVVSRLANAEILPFDYAQLAYVFDELATHLESEVRTALEAATATEHAVGDAALEAMEDSPIARSVRVAMAGLRTSIETIREAAGDCASALDAALRGGPLAPETTRRVNEHLRAAGQSLTNEAGLPGDAWSRQLLFASDPDNGYATLPMPAVRLALRAGDLESTAARIDELARHLEGAAVHLAAARALLHAPQLWADLLGLFGAYDPQDEVPDQQNESHLERDRQQRHQQPEEQAEHHHPDEAQYQQSDDGPYHLASPDSLSAPVDASGCSGTIERWLILFVSHYVRRIGEVSCAPLWQPSATLAEAGGRERSGRQPIPPKSPQKGRLGLARSLPER
jgi:hypothetical protein